MLPIPTPPTDSFYKFLFVTGVIFIGYSEYLRSIETPKQQYFFFRVDSLLDKTKKHIDSMHNLSISHEKEKKVVDSQASSFIKQWTQIVSSNTKLSDRELIKLNKRVDSIDHKETASINVNDSDFKIVNGLLDNEILLQKRLDLRYNEIRQTTRNWWEMEILGFFLMLFGALFWYLKCQVILDRILSLQLRQLQSNISKEQNEPLNQLTFRRKKRKSLPPEKRR